MKRDTDEPEDYAVEIKPVRRDRPYIGVSVAADVAAELRRLAESEGGFFSHTVERVLRRGLGMEGPPKAA